MPEDQKTNGTIADQTVDRKAIKRIPYPHLQDIHRNYVNNSNPILSFFKKKPETKSIWFEKNTNLVAFFQDVLNTGDVSGVRVYLCEYDRTNLPTLPSGTDPEDYINKITVGMVATIDAGNGKHPDHPSSQEDNGFLVLTLEPLNNGKLCPPDCP